MGKPLPILRCSAGWPPQSAAHWMRLPLRWPGWEQRAQRMQGRRTSKPAFVLEFFSPLLLLEAVFLVLSLALMGWWNSYSSGIGARLSPLLLLLKYLWTGRSCSREWSNLMLLRIMEWHSKEFFVNNCRNISKLFNSMDLRIVPNSCKSQNESFSTNMKQDFRSEKNLLGSFRVPF